MTRPEMIAELITEQNRIACAGCPIDIMTITGLMTDDELAEHLLRNAAYMPEPKATRRARRAA